MTPIETEKYCFLRLYQKDLSDASHSLSMLKRFNERDVRQALIRDTAIIYARPFSGNQGNLVKKHFLSLKHVPKSFRVLHDQLISLRNEHFAHCSLKANQPVLNETDSGFEIVSIMTRAIVNYDAILNCEADIAELIAAVEKSVVTDLLEIHSRI